MSGNPPGRQSGQLLFVNYHYIRERGVLPHPGIHPITMGELRAQLEMLLTQMPAATREQVDAWVEGRQDLPGPCFMPTFDDGLWDHLQAAEEVLAPLGIQGAFFVNSRPLIERRALMVQKVHWLRATTPADAFVAELERLLPETQRLCAADGGFDPSVYPYDTPAAARLKYCINVVLPQDEVDRVTDRMLEARGVSLAEFSSRTYMDASALRRLRDLGHVVGAHGHDHIPMAKLPPAVRVPDLQRNIECLEGILGRRPTWFAYPNGRRWSVPDDAESVGRTCGLTMALTLMGEWNFGDESPWRMGRWNTNDVDAALAFLPARSRLAG